MCGITGIINPKGKEDIEKMTRVILHRGPDDEGYFSDQYVALGMRRLSIIDLVRGKQPVTSLDDRFLIFFNGEIYNYKEIKKELTDYEFKTESDTEVILAGFLKWGTDVLPRLRGMFAFCIYDREDNKVFIARDFFGIKPLYYFKNVFKLPPAHYMIVDAKLGKTEIKKYWQFEFKQNNALEEGKTAGEILDVMKDSVEHHMIADVPVGSFLSGGIDSSIIATLMHHSTTLGARK